MAVERVILCGGAAARSPGEETAALHLHLYGPARNVYREGDDLRDGVYDRFPDELLDLLDIAAYVYAADQAVSRQQSGGDFERNWRRALTFRVPVRNPDRWRSAEVGAALESVLSFLSDDEYHFEFVPSDHRPQPTLLDGAGTIFDGLADEVVLFSGGLDSLGGAVREVLTDRRRVLLVNHRSNPKPGPRLGDLSRLFDQLAGAARPFWKRVRINKASDLSVETTQRSRSFLYAALGAVYARMIGLPRVRFYENGVVSLNLPIGRQVVGARATRTTHPRVLAGFTRLFSLLAERPLAVENPFLGLTKTDVVRAIADAGGGELIRHTVSCAETRGRSTRHPHCGDCSQCIDRRFAVLAAGVERDDPADGYEVDLLTGRRGEAGSRTLLASYLDVTTRVGRMTADEFAGRFGEVSRVLRHLPGTPRQALAEVYRLYRRHAEQVNGVVDRELAAAAAAGKFRDPGLPVDCLIRLMADTPEVTAVEPAGEPDNVFVRKGRAYSVRFRGGEGFVLLPGKGAAYLHALLSRPDVPVTAATLATRVSQCRVQLGVGSGGEKADRESLSAYRQRVAELRQDVETAKADNDPAGQQVAERELDVLMTELRTSLTLQGRMRKLGDEREKVRKAVYNAISRAVAEIRESDPILADHLDLCVAQGHTLLYRPDGVSWLT